MNTLRIFNHHIHIKFVILGIVHFALAAASVYAATEIRYVGDDAAMMRDYSTRVLYCSSTRTIFVLDLTLNQRAVGHSEN